MTIAPAVPSARKRRTAAPDPATASERFSAISSTTSRAEEVCNAASRKTAALLTQPLSVPLDAAICTARAEHGVVARVPGDRPDPAAEPVGHGGVDDDDRAVLAEPLRDRPADAAGAARDDERAGHRRSGTTTSIPLCSLSMRLG